MANVGDSSALLCSSHPCMSRPANLTYLLDSALTPSTEELTTPPRPEDRRTDNSSTSGSRSVDNNLNESENNSGSGSGDSSSSIVTEGIKTKSNTELVVRSTILYLYNAHNIYSRSYEHVCTVCVCVIGGELASKPVQ